jgi:endonuclease-3
MTRTATGSRALKVRLKPDPTLQVRLKPDATGRVKPDATGRASHRRALNVSKIMRALARAIDDHDLPAVEKIAEESQQDPFEVLISTMLSAQTRDPVTAAATARLFAVARTPAAIAKLTVKQIEKLIYPVSFYRHKAKHVKETCRILAEERGGRVPGTMDELLKLPGVGRKTANLVLILSFKSLQNICVDTHVHRISNRLGWVTTRTPEETEQALYRATDKRWWPYINLYLVTWGQNVCRPVYPRCGECVIRESCARVGVTTASKIERRNLAPRANAKR